MTQERPKIDKNEIKILTEILYDFRYVFFIDFRSILDAFWDHFGSKIDEKRDIRMLLVSEAILKRNFMNISLNK